jgi:NAD+ synthase
MLTNENVINNIKEWFNKNNIKTAVINISGGADSTYVAYALVKALGKENVIGLLQPNGEQKDISDALEVVKNLQIKYHILNINEAFDTLVDSFKGFTSTLTVDDYKKFKGEYDFENAVINLAPRLRMANAYMIANAVNGAVIGTGNASERYVGYFTKWGDGACDFNPIKDICKTDLIQMGLELGIPEHLIKKIPADGLSDKTDEEKYGFSYKVLDEYIKTGVCEDYKIKERIDKMHKNSRHKFEEI